MAKKDSELKKLLSLASGTGIDPEGLLIELAGEIARRLPDNTEKVAESLVEKVQGRLSAQLSESVEAIKGMVAAGAQPVDVEKIINGVANTLKPTIIEVAKNTVSEAFVANSKALTSEVYRVMDARFNELKTAASGNGEGSASAVISGTKLDIGNLVAQLLANADGISKLVAAFRGTGGADQQIASQLQTIFRWHNVLTKLESGKATSEELTKGIADIAKSKE